MYDDALSGSLSRHAVGFSINTPPGTPNFGRSGRRVVRPDAAQVGALLRLDPAEDQIDALDFEDQRTFWQRLRAVLTGKTLLLQLLLIAVMTAEVLFRKATTTVYMQNYRAFLNNVVVFCAAIVFFVVVFYKKFVAKNLEETINKRLFGWFVAISVFDTLATYMVVLANASVSAPLATLLSQGVIPFSIAGSAIFMKKRFHWVHYTGAAVILGGIGASVAASRADNSSSTGWSIVFFLSNVPITLSSLLKEVVMSNPVHPAEMNSLNAWVALIQFFMGLALSPAGFLLQAPGSATVSASDMPRNFANGFNCWITGTNAIVAADNAYHMPLDDCANAPWAVWLHIALVVVLNIVALLVIFYGSAVMFFIAGAVSIPLTALVSALSFMGPLREGFDALQLFGMALTLLGLVVYRLKPEHEAGAAPAHGEALLDAGELDAYGE